MAKTYEEIMTDIEKRGLKTIPSEQKGWIDVPEYGNETGGWVAENNLVVRPSGVASVMLPENAVVPKAMPIQEAEGKEVAPKFAGKISDQDRKAIFDKLDKNQPAPVFKRSANEKEMDIPINERIKDVREEDVNNFLAKDLIRRGANPSRVNEVKMTLDQFPNMSRDKKMQWIGKHFDELMVPAEEEVMIMQPLNV